MSKETYKSYRASWARKTRSLGKNSKLDVSLPFAAAHRYLKRLQLASATARIKTQRCEIRH